MALAKATAPPTALQALSIGRMGPKHTAMLYGRQALLGSCAYKHNASMLRLVANKREKITATQMAAKFRECFPGNVKGLTGIIADACNVSKQAVSNWRRDGRFDKAHLPVFVELSGRKLEWWFDFALSRVAFVNKPRLSASISARLLAIEHRLRGRPELVKQFAHNADELLLFWERIVLEDGRATHSPSAGSALPRQTPAKRKRGN